MAQYRLLSSIGLFDARKLNADYQASLPLDAKKLTAGQVVDLPDEAAAYLRKRFRGAEGLLEKIEGRAKPADLKGVNDSK